MIVLNVEEKVFDEENHRGISLIQQKARNR